MENETKTYTVEECLIEAHRDPSDLQNYSGWLARAEIAPDVDRLTSEEYDAVMDIIAACGTIEEHGEMIDGILSRLGNE